jgi:hypothetical protein
VERADRYKVKVDEYIHYRREGYLKVEGLVSQEDVAKLYAWAMERWEDKPQSHVGRRTRRACINCIASIPSPSGGCCTRASSMCWRR